MEALDELAQATAGRVARPRYEVRRFWTKGKIRSVKWAVVLLFIALNAAAIWAFFNVDAVREHFGLEPLIMIEAQP